MKCINCKKEVKDESIYCVYCGEELSNIDNDDIKYNYNVDNQKIYNQTKTNIKEYGAKVKGFVSKNKMVTMIGALVILALIIGLTTIGFLKGRPVNKKEIQSYLIGQELQVDGVRYLIKEGQIKSLEITSRKSVKKQSDKIQGVITLDLDNVTVEADIGFDLLYNKKGNEWTFGFLNRQEIKEIEPKIDINDSIKDLLKNASINYSYNEIDLKEGLLKDITEIKVNGTGLRRDGTAQLFLSNGVIETTVSVDFEAEFNLEEGSWKLNSDYLNNKVINKEKVAENISDKDKKDFVLSAFANGLSFIYKYKDGEYDNYKNISIEKDNISEVKINNFMEYEDTIRVEIEGQAVSGDISKINFSGVINLKLSLSTTTRSETEVTIDVVELRAVDVDELKKELLKFKLEDKLITVAIADSFKLGSENKDSRMFDKVYDGTLSVNGKEEKVKVNTSIKYNDETKKYQWNLTNIQVIKQVEE